MDGTCGGIREEAKVNVDQLIIGDLHGNYEGIIRAMTKLGYWVENPDGSVVRSPYKLYWAVQVGDFLHMGYPTKSPSSPYYGRSDEKMLELRHLFNIVLVGNHEACYAANLQPGFSGMWEPQDIPESIFQVLCEKNRGLFLTHVATVVGPYLVTHAGLDLKWLASYYFDIRNDPYKISDRLNSRFEHAKNAGAHNGYYPDITSVGWSSKFNGPNDVGGCLWLRPSEYTKPHLDRWLKLKQICGHTPSWSHPKKYVNGITVMDNDGISILLYRDETLFDAITGKILDS